MHSRGNAACVEIMGRGLHYLNQPPPATLGGSSLTSDSLNEARRTSAMFRICQHHRYGEIDGIRFDFRHPEIPVSKWLMPTITTRRGTPGTTIGKNKPYFWFPWYGNFESHGGNTIMPDVILTEGDIISIADVETQVIGKQFSSPPDREVKRAVLKVTHSDGSTETIRNGIIFRAAAAVVEDIASHSIFDAISLRIMEFFKIESVRNVTGINANSEAEYRALSGASFIEEYFGDLRPLLEESPIRSEDHKFTFELWDVINSAVGMGYFWAQVEAEAEILPLAGQAKQIELRAIDAGRKSGASRRAKSQESWRDEAKQIALAFRKDNPGISQDDLATEIIWILKSENLPKHGTVKAYLITLEREGTLPRNNRRRAK